ncbi:chemotaxis protein CheX [Bacillus cereus]|uniref:Chemotaxis phosphatase CheX-like domain-containing protein n=1 Tax=Bacillus cereus TaxID=1396 RepID=A0A164P6L6_BACCE|nr:chemotaxis protein CheX [Bacillus cereus]KZD66331.1 hypothetical protein B4088_2447 [Bacillus cereus]
MRADYINAILNSSRQTVQTLFGVEPEKKEMYVTDILETPYSHILHFQLDGELFGVFAISFPEEVAIEMCKKMTGGMVETLDDMGLSALEESGNMIKGGIVNSLGEWNSDIPMVLLLNKNELALLPTQTLVIEAESEIGPMQFHISVHSMN